MTSTPGAKGPDRKRWVLGEDSGELRKIHKKDTRFVVFQLAPQSYYAINVLHVHSLAVGHCGVLNEGEVVGDVLVVR